MVFRKIANNKKFKCKVPLPLLVGFVVGFLSVYMCLLLNFDDDRKLLSTTVKLEHSPIHFNHYHRVDFTKPSVNRNLSLLCVIFIDDIDMLFMQKNVWLKKCGNNLVHVSKKKHKYIDHVVTGTYSSHPWKCYCQTLIYLHNKYNSGHVKYDWIILAKDNVWVIYENLIHLISLLNNNKYKYNYYAGQYENEVLNMDAGVLMSTSTLSALVNSLSDADACNTMPTKNERLILDYHLKKLNNVIPVSNMDSHGCTLFHSMNIFEIFNSKNLRPEILKKCLSSSAITFQLDLKLHYYAMYVLYKIRLVTKDDLINNKILPIPLPSDENIWRVEAYYELNLDPSNMSQTDFFYYWSKKRQIIL